MNEAVESVRTEHEMSLRGRCAHAHLPCKDRGEGSVPAVPPEDFTVVMGAVLAGGTERELRDEMDALGGPEEGYGVLMNVLEWVESVFARCREVREDQEAGEEATRGDGLGEPDEVVEGFESGPEGDGK